MQDTQRGLTNILDHIATSLELLQRNLGVIREEQSVPTLIAHGAER